jgi:hypothetical protein
MKDSKAIEARFRNGIGNGVESFSALLDAWTEPYPYVRLGESWVLFPVPYRELDPAGQLTTGGYMSCPTCVFKCGHELWHMEFYTPSRTCEVSWFLFALGGT